MLRSITIDNFKSLINVTYELGALNLVIGENNSGKTNLYQALRFLSLTSRAPLADAAKEAVADLSNLSNVNFNNPTIDFSCICSLPVEEEVHQFDYSLSIEFTRPGFVGSPPLPIPMTLRVQAETLSVSDSHSRPTVLLENRAGTCKVLDELCLSEGEVEDKCYRQLYLGSDRTALHNLYRTEATKRLSVFKSYLERWLYYDLETLRLRGPEAKPFDSVLNSEGSNLASVLYNLNNTNPRALRQLIEIARTLEPKLDAINFIAPTQDQVFMFVEDDRGHRFPVSNVSNGTLRFLALAYVFVTTMVQNQNWKPSPPLTIIEEPENGIHVGYFKRLFQLLDPSGADGQYIFTSHSPYFIDLFDAHLENVVVMKRSETHSQLVKPDPEKLQKYLEEIPLGELHFRDMIA
jgi:predicted ATPase